MGCSDILQKRDPSPAVAGRNVLFFTDEMQVSFLNDNLQSR